MVHRVPLPSIRYIDDLANALLLSFPAGDPEAQRLVRKNLRVAPQPGDWSLADCHQLLARIHQVETWDELFAGIVLIREIAEGKKTLPTDAEVDLVVTMIGARYPVGSYAQIILNGLGRHGFLGVLRGMSHTNARVRSECSSFLDHYVKSWDPETYEALECALDDTNERVRSASLHAMGCMRCKTDTPGDEAIPLFMRGLQDKSARVRKTALAGLYQFRGDYRARQGYLAALHDAHAPVRKSAASSLAKDAHDADVIDALLDLLTTESNDNVIVTALQALTEGCRHWKGTPRRKFELHAGAPANEVAGGNGRLWCFYPAAALSSGQRDTPRGFWVRVLCADRRLRSFRLQRDLAIPESQAA